MQPSVENSEPIQEVQPSAAPVVEESAQQPVMEQIKAEPIAAESSEQVSAAQPESVPAGGESLDQPLLEKPEEKSDANASVGASIVNMTNNVLGSGLVALAYSVSRCSLIPGILLLLTLAAIACLSQIIITRSCKLTEKYTYKEMGEATFGRTGGFIISLIMLLYTCGSCISYFVIIGDLFLDIFSYLLPTVKILQTRAVVVGCICVLFIFPLCMMKTVDSLKYVSFLSILFIFVTVGVVFGSFVSKHTINETVEIFHMTSQFFLVIPVMCVSFNCHYNVPRYYYELKDRSTTRMWKTSIGASCLILFVYLTVSISGYLLFGKDTLGNILNNFEHDSIPPTIARIGLGVGIVCHFPIAYFAVRTNLHSLFCSMKEFHAISLRLVTAIGVLLCTCTVAVVVTKVETVLGLNGSLFGSLIMFTIPGLMYVRAAKDVKNDTLNKVEAWFMIIFGIIVCIGGTTLTIMKLVRGE